MLSNRASRRTHAAAAPVLTARQRAAVDELTRDGIAVMRFEELVDDPVLWDELTADMRAFEADAELATGAGAPSNPSRAWKPFLIRRHRERAHTADDPGAAGTFATRDPWLRLGVAEGVLGVVNAYRGLQTRLIELDQWYTIPIGDTSAPTRSQNWHRDPEDRHVVKAFVYFSDVDEQAGPFAYVRGSRPGGRCGRQWPWTFTDRNPYPDAERFSAVIPPEEIVTVTGRAGTVILCDTSGFHRGGLATAKARLLSLHIYVSPAALAAQLSKRRFSVSGADAAPTPSAATAALGA